MLPSRFLLLMLVPLAATSSLRGGEPSVSTLANTPAPDGKDLKEAVAPVPDASIWRISAGYEWRQLGLLDWRTGSMAARTPLPWLVGRPSHSSVAGSGTLPPAGIGNHAYTNGFVNEDGGTASDGETWNWGYNNASQVQGSGLAFHASVTGPASSVTTAGSSSYVRNSGGSDNLDGSGWFASLESPVLFKAGGVELTLEAGYSYAADGSANMTEGVFNAMQRSTTTTTAATTTNVTDLYDTSGIIVPTAPYAGTFAGPGPLINNAPVSRSVTTSGVGSKTSTLSAFFHSNVAENFDMHLNTISLGPRFSGEWQRVRFGLGTGLALNVADWSANYQETLYVRQNGGASRVLNTFNANSSSADVLPGFYLDARAELELTSRISLFAGGRYDWAGSLGQSAGASQFNFSLKGWTVMGGLTLSL